MVLDAIRASAEVAESDAVLYRLSLDVIADASRSLVVKMLTGARPWSTLVNGARAPLYDRGNGEWLLERRLGETGGHVQLSFLQAAQALRLKRRLELQLPSINIAAKRLNVALQLPRRVQFLALDGALQSASRQTATNKPHKDASQYHFFSRSIAAKLSPWHCTI